MKLFNSKSIVIQKPIGKDWKTTVGNRYHFPVICGEPEYLQVYKQFLFFIHLIRCSLAHGGEVDEVLETSFVRMQSVIISMKIFLKVAHDKLTLEEERTESH